MILATSPLSFLPGSYPKSPELEKTVALSVSMPNSPQGCAKPFDVVENFCLVSVLLHF